MTTTLDLSHGDDCYIGDPCYVIRDDDRWSEFNKAFDCKFREEAGGVICLPGSEHHIAVYKPMYGDGDYTLCSNGDEVGNFGVDSGMIACIPLKTLQELYMVSDDCIERGCIVSFKRSSLSTSYNNGTITFGQYTIDTDSRPQPRKRQHVVETVDYPLHPGSITHTLYISSEHQQTI